MKRFLGLAMVLIMLIPLCSCEITGETSSGESENISGLSADCSLETFSFSIKSNPWLTEQIRFTVNQETKTVTAKGFPCVYSEPMRPTFKAEGKSVLIDGTEIISGETAVMIRADSVLTVVAENGATCDYSLVTEDTSNGLPVVFIKTENAQPVTSLSEYVRATISVVGGERSFYAEPVSMRARGNSTAGYEKKPYRLKFDNSVNILGMGDFDNWVMLADFFDRTLLRTQIMHSFASKLEGIEYTPATDLCEVYLNGAYVGVYNIGHHIEADESKVDIEQGSPEADTGYLIEIDARAAEEGFILGKDLFMLGGAYMCIDYPKVVNSEQFAYISEYCERIKRLVEMQSEYVWEYIDLDSFIDWYIVNELSRNTDSAMFLSTRLHKDAGGKLCMGPVWDFDLSCGNADYGDQENPEGWYLRWALLYRSLFEYQEFRDALKARWNELMETYIPEIFEEIDYYEKKIEKAYNANFERWKIFGTYVWPTPSVIVGYTTQAQHDDFLRNFLSKRIEWLDNAINSLE